MKKALAQITLRPATRADARTILELEEAGMRAYAEALWGNWRASASVETLDLAGHEMILLDGDPVGCIACGLQDGDLVVRKLYIAAAARRSGIGAFALRRKTTEHGGRVRLRTLSTNDDAVRFYVREGFSILSRDAEHVYFERAQSA